MIPHNRPLITPADRAAVDAALASGWIAQGREVAAVEERFVELLSGGGACAVSSGTAALFLALRALGAGAGETVALPSYACSALLNAVYMTGAVPRIVDVLPGTFCIDPDGVRTVAQDARFVVAVHTYGAPAEIRAVQSPGRLVIEDCCHAPGGSVHGKPLGGSGEAAVYSFYATKVVTGGQGGLVWSRNESLLRDIRDYRQFDRRDAYVPRFNFQMTDLQAALVNSQMARLDAIRTRRAEIALRYLEDLPRGFSTQADPQAAGRMMYRFVLVARDAKGRDALREHLDDSGVECSVPVERFELLHRYLRLDPGAFPVSEQLADTTLSLPLHLGLGDEEVSFVCSALRGFKS